ncbi:hypothetical protein R5W24_003668 [Gemmata sp. JC717]|uniref:WD40 repeat domain-containing protein n=1 Tax=Gemmata algarum TaxID=2975278 RepID=UPI0021BA4AD6|nr:hypothetical protein [Gemmata algarum]MDY3554544.1 hypothetical protein [Gemmata algarum]
MYEIGPLAAPAVTLPLSRDNQMLATGTGKDVRIITLSDENDSDKFTQPADMLGLSSTLYDAVAESMVRVQVRARCIAGCQKYEGPVGHCEQLFWIALSNDRKWLASASSDKSVKLWDVAAAKAVRDFPNPDLKPMFEGEAAPSRPGGDTRLRFNPGGNHSGDIRAAACGKAYLAVRNVADGTRVFGSPRDLGPIHAMTVMPDGTRIVIGYVGAPRIKFAPGALILKFPAK